MNTNFYFNIEDVNTLSNDFIDIANKINDSSYTANPYPQEQIYAAYDIIDAVDRLYYIKTVEQKDKYLKQLYDGLQVLGINIYKFNLPKRIYEIFETEKYVKEESYGYLSEDDSDLNSESGLIPDKKEVSDVFTEELDKQFENNREYSNLKNSYEVTLLNLSIAKDLNAFESVEHFEERLQNIENKVKKNYIINTMKSNKVNFLASTLYDKNFIMKVSMYPNPKIRNTIISLSNLYKNCLSSEKPRIEHDIQNFVNSVIGA